jgi:hypothetical protein
LSYGNSSAKWLLYVAQNGSSQHGCWANKCSYTQNHSHERTLMNYCTRKPTEERLVSSRVTGTDVSKILSFVIFLFTRHSLPSRKLVHYQVFWLQDIQTVHIHKATQMKVVTQYY